MRGRLGQLNGRLTSVGRPAGRMSASDASQTVSPDTRRWDGVASAAQMSLRRQQRPGRDHFGGSGPEQRRHGGEAPELSRWAVGSRGAP